MFLMLFSVYFHIGLLLILSLVTLGISISYAVTPGERKLGMLRPLSVATLFSVLNGVVAGLGVAFLHASQGMIAGRANVSAMLFAGLAESAVPAVIGFTVLAVCWILVAVGLRRQI